MTRLTSLRNIGPKSAGWLESVGIHTIDDLFDFGAVKAYQMVKLAYPDRVTLNLLYALQGALLDLPWNELPHEMKAMLRRQIEEEK